MKTKTLPKCTPTETKRIRKKENRKVMETEMIENCPKTKKAANFFLKCHPKTKK